MNGERITLRTHAIRQIFERGLLLDDVLFVVRSGEAIERYGDAYPFPSRLVLGFAAGRPLHVVVAEHATANELIVVTVYEPDPSEWSPDFRRRLR